MNQSRQQSVYRVLNLIRLLNSHPRRKAKHLMQILECTKSTFYRDIKLLEDLGYCPDTDQYDRHYLHLQLKGSKQSILDSDELFFLQDHLQRVAADSVHARSILHKFDRNLNMIPLVDALPQLYAQRILRLATHAIDSQICLLVKGYRSMSSDTVEDRRVEPLEITPDHRYLIAWDLEKDRQSQYKIVRIQDIELLPGQRVDPQRIPSPIDLFGLTGTEWLDVRLRLSKLAHSLLLEEFPLSRPFVHRRQNGTFFEGRVRSWKGVGRFVLGLPGEVEVLGPEAFRGYLRERRAT